MKIAVVTGASSGIGREFALQIPRLYKNLDEIWVMARRTERLEELKKQISVMAMLKLNRLHLHLTDNQGWRIAIDKYPQLVEYSAVQETYNEELYGPCYYTKEDIKAFPF